MGLQGSDRRQGHLQHQQRARRRSTTGAGGSAQPKRSRNIQCYSWKCAFLVLHNQRTRRWRRLRLRHVWQLIGDDLHQRAYRNLTVNQGDIAGLHPNAAIAGVSKRPSLSPFGGFGLFLVFVVVAGHAVLRRARWGAFICHFVIRKWQKGVHAQRPGNAGVNR